MKLPIFAHRLLGQLLKTDSYRAGSLVHMLYSYEIFKYSECRYVIEYLTSVQFQNTKPFLTTAWVNNKFSAALNSSLQIFTDLISWNEKQMKCIWRITCLEEDVLVVFPTEFDMKHDSESDVIVSPHIVVVVSPLE